MKILFIIFLIFLVKSNDLEFNEEDLRLDNDMEITENLNHNNNRRNEEDLMEREVIRNSNFDPRTNGKKTIRYDDEEFEEGAFNIDDFNVNNPLKKGKGVNRNNINKENFGPGMHRNPKINNMQGMNMGGHPTPPGMEEHLRGDMPPQDQSQQVIEGNKGKGNYTLPHEIDYISEIGSFLLFFLFIINLFFGKVQNYNKLERWNEDTKEFLDKNYAHIGFQNQKSLNEFNF